MKIFISYRRIDSQDITMRIRDALELPPKAMRSPRQASGADAQALMPVPLQSDPPHRARGCSRLLGHKRERAQHRVAISELMLCGLPGSGRPIGHAAPASTCAHKGVDMVGQSITARDPTPSFGGSVGR
jgi:hypothetical protein